jgi:hypothetical protein
MPTKEQTGTALGAVSAPRAVSRIKACIWKQAIVRISIIGCGLAPIIATLGVVTGASKGLESGQARPSSAIRRQAYEGIITDTQCGARHSAAIGRTAADCTVVCVRGGEQFALVDGDTSYLLEGDLVALKQVAGRRVRIIGTLNGEKISVTSVDTT